MKLNHIVVAFGLAAAAPAFAAIAPGTSGNGELFLSVYNFDAKVSYTLDLGVSQDQFCAVGSACTGFDKSWSLAGDTYLQTFLQNADLSTTKWAVNAVDSTGGIAVDKFRAFVTVQAGSEDLIDTWSNLTFGNGVGSSQAGQFFNAINTTGSHGAPGSIPDFAINGSSVNFESDVGKSYFGELGGLSDTYNGNAPFSTGNEIGTESNFFYLTRSGNDNGAGIKKTQFGNESGAAKFLFAETANGYELTYTTATAAVPEPETYALMLAGLVTVGAIARRRKTGF